MLILLRSDGELDFLPVWPEAVGLLSGRYSIINRFSNRVEKLVPHDVTKEHELYLLCPDLNEKAPWIFQVGYGSTIFNRTFTLDRIVESWILRVDTTPPVPVLPPGVCVDHKQHRPSPHSRRAWQTQSRNRVGPDQGLTFLL